MFNCFDQFPGQLLGKLILQYDTVIKINRLAALSGRTNTRKLAITSTYVHVLCTLYTYLMETLYYYLTNIISKISGMYMYMLIAIIN